MKTSKPFATISYNSADFLTVKLTELIERRKIDFFAFIHHLPEEDEEKEHKHLYIVPNGQIDTDTVVDYLLEFDALHPDKPLGCIRPRSSKFGDWYLYGLHDEAYLSSKGQSRKYHYSRDEFIVSDKDYFTEEIHLIDFTSINRFQQFKQGIADGQTFGSMVNSGMVPIQQINAYDKAYDLVTQELNRQGRSTHTPKSEIDVVTGEIKGV